VLCCRTLRSYLNIKNTVQLSPSVDYKGSIFAWSTKSVRTSNIWRETALHINFCCFKKCPFSYSCVLCVFPSLLAIVPAIPIVLICIIALLIALVLTFVIALVYYGIRCSLNQFCLYFCTYDYFNEIAYL